MTENVRTHAIDMNAILRGREAEIKHSEIAIKVENLDLYYGQKQALHKINMEIPKRRVTA